jgi:hypothetical protein
MELSNVEAEGYSFFTYETLKNNVNYIELVNRTASRQSYFDDMDMQLSNDSKEVQ